MDIKTEIGVYVKRYLHVARKAPDTHTQHGVQQWGIVSCKSLLFPQQPSNQVNEQG